MAEMKNRHLRNVAFLNNRRRDYSARRLRSGRLKTSFDLCCCRKNRRHFVRRQKNCRRCDHHCDHHLVHLIYPFVAPIAVMWRIFAQTVRAEAIYPHSTERGHALYL